MEQADLDPETRRDLLDRIEQYRIDCMMWESDGEPFIDADLTLASE